MAAVMTKRGTQDNVVTYEHVCDTTADMAAINPQYINLGSICLVINGESGGLEVYIADSNKEWSAISVAAGGGGGGESGGLSIHICSANEYDSTTKTPTITAPAADTIYLVPTSSTTGDLFSEWIYVDSAWERIGGTSIDLSQYATKTDLNNYVAKSDYDPTDRYIELFYDTDTDSYSWASDTAQHFATLSDICQSTIDFDKRPSVYAVMSAEDDYDTETESGLYNHGRIFPLIFAHSKQGSKVSDGSEVIENLAIFGSTYTNDNGQLVFESFTITNHTLPSDYPQDDVITHSITPIGSSDLSQYMTIDAFNNYNPGFKSEYIKIVRPNSSGYNWDLDGSSLTSVDDIYNVFTDITHPTSVYAYITGPADNEYLKLPLTQASKNSNNFITLTFIGLTNEKTTVKFTMTGRNGNFNSMYLLKNEPFTQINIYIDDNTGEYKWSPVNNDIGDIYNIYEMCGYSSNDRALNIYAITTDGADLITEGDEEYYNNRVRIYPLISANYKHGANTSTDEDIKICKLIFGTTYTNDDGQLVSDSFTIVGEQGSYTVDNTVTRTITPIASSAGSFTAAEELSDVVTNLKSLVQEVAYTTSSSHAAATITSIDTLLTALDTMKPQPTYTANVIYENFTNNATRFSTDNVPINFANGDYVEALIDVTTCSQDQENILSVGTSIESFDAAVAYLFYWRNNKIHVRLKDVEASIAVDRYVEANDYSAVLIRIDSTGVYIDGTLVPGMTGDNVAHINSAGTYKIGCRMSKLNTATYDHITVYNKNQEGLYVKIYNYSGEEITLEGSGDLTSRDYYCAFSLFETIGVVGDSYANGYCGEDPTATAGINHPNLSWPQVLARRHGVDVKNYAWGGMSTATFITNTSYGLPVLTADAPRCLYILALERNDYNRENSGEAGYIGSITDITSHSLGSYPDTFYGNYATIIETIQNHAPKARIVMMSGDYSESNALGHAYNLAVIEIAEHYGLPCMVQREDIYFQGDNAYYREKPAGGHPSAVAYTGMEMAIERLFNKCVKDNIAYFEYYTGVPTT